MAHWLANDNAGGSGRSLLDDIVRDGARKMLAAASKAGVAAYLDAHAHLVGEARPPPGGAQRLPR